MHELAEDTIAAPRSDGGPARVNQGPSTWPGRIGLKKLLILPVAFAVALAVADAAGPNNLARGGFLPALIAGSGLAAALFCAKDGREYSSIVAGVFVGTVCGFASIIRCMEHMCLVVGPAMGWLTMRFFRSGRWPGSTVVQKVKVGESR
jgi:hypothetical protein